MKRRDIRFDGTRYWIRLPRSSRAASFIPIRFVQDDASWGKPTGGLIRGTISDGREIVCSCRRLMKTEDEVKLSKGAWMIVKAVRGIADIPATSLPEDMLSAVRWLRERAQEDEAENREENATAIAMYRAVATHLEWWVERDKR